MGALPPDDDPIAEAETLIGLGRAAEAAASLESRIKAGRGGLLARLALVRALLAREAFEHALEAAREAVQLNPTVSLAAASLGDALLAAGALPTAIAEFHRALRLDPDLVVARLGLGRAWLAAGEPEKALEALSSLEGDAVAVEIAHARAMLGQTRADARYVRHLFDQFSADYDTRMLGELSYAAPTILRELASLVLPARRGLVVLDLGCGTGLAGVAFKDIAAQLDGIDLSPKMIEACRARRIYASLGVDDMESALSAREDAYDLILAADALVYLGDLSKVFAGVHVALREGSSFLFTVEKKSGDGFALGPKRRWRHAESYLRDAAERAQLEVIGFLECTPRTEGGLPVEGFAVALSKAAP